MNSIPLNPDVIQHIGSYLNPSQAVAFTQVNKSMRANSDELLRQQFRETFGQINPAYQPDKTVMARLLCAVEKDPNALLPLTLRPPRRGFERWKWLLGLENRFDKEIQEENYTTRLLENTTATSIIQLKHQMIAYGHIYRPIEARLIRREFEIKRLRLIMRIFLVCLGNFLRLFCKSSFLNGKSLQKRSEKTFVKIGGFNCDGKDYDVVAFHPVRITLSPEFRSDRALVVIFEREEFHSWKEHLESAYYRNHNFDVQIGKEVIVLTFLIPERHLKIGLRPMDAYESNRPLDQRLIQIMVEMAMQNKDIISLRIGHNADNPHLSLKVADLTKRNVSYSGGAFESWLDIIRREPILEPGVAILPED